MMHSFTMNTEHLEQGTTTLTQLKQQLIIKSVLCTFNETLALSTTNLRWQKG